MLPPLALSLQFAKLEHAASHRSALPRHQVARWIRHALEADGEITVRIVDLDEGRSLNHAFRHKDYATNVLTFYYAKKPSILADLVLCAPIVHGVLHAQGWDHETSKKDADAMEKHEIAILAKLGFANPYQ